MVLPTSPPDSMSVSQILTEFGIPAGTTKRISQDLFSLVGGTAGSTCFLGASFSGKSAGPAVGYSTIAGSGNDIGYGIAVDSAGNIYITGAYTSTTTVPINTFGTAPTASGVSLPITQSTDVFVVKWNANGTVAGYSTVVANVRVSNPGIDVGYGIAVDSSQNIYITGQYNSTTTVPINTFGTAPTASGLSLPTTNVGDAFVIKWNANGTVAGYSYLIGTSADAGNGIAIDSSRNIYITGQYTSSTTVPINTFGTAPVASGVSMPVSVTTDAFVIKWKA